MSRGEPCSVRRLALRGASAELLGADIALVRQPSPASPAILECQHVSGRPGAPGDEGSEARRPGPQDRIDTVGPGEQAPALRPRVGPGRG